MNLGDFNFKNLGKDLTQSKALSNLVNNFIKELKDYLEKGDNRNSVNVVNQNKYSNYWDYQNFIEDNVSANIGLSRYGNDITYYNKLNKAVDNSILELSEKEGTLYRKQFTANGSSNGGFYNVDKFENGTTEHVSLSEEKIPKSFKDEDIIFQFDENENIQKWIKKSKSKNYSQKESSFFLLLYCKNKNNVLKCNRTKTKKQN